MKAPDPVAFNGASLELLRNFTGYDVNFPFFIRERGDPAAEYPFIMFQTYNGESENPLWISNGTSDGTEILVDSQPFKFSRSVMPYKGRYYFAMSNDEHGAELWETEGKRDTTRLFKDLVPGPEDSNPADFTLFGGEFYFSAGETVLWKTDGTVSHTSPIVNFSDPVFNLSLPEIRDVAAFDQFLLVTVRDYDVENGFDLPGIVVRSDGTADGTIVLTSKVVDARIRSRQPVLDSGQIIFHDDNGLWSTEGDPENTQLIVSDLPIRRVSSSVVNGKALFDVERTFIFTTDGTASGTLPLNVTNPGATNITYFELEGYGVVSSFDGRVNFGPSFGDGRVSFLVDGWGPGIAWGTFLWMTGGDDSNTELLHVFYESAPRDAILLPNGRFILRTSSDQVWLYDGTADGTNLLAEGNEETDGDKMAALSSNALVLGFLSGNGEVGIWRLDIPANLSPPDAFDAQETDPLSSTSDEPSAVTTAAPSLTPSVTPSKFPSNMPTLTLSSKPSVIPSASNIPSDTQETDPPSSTSDEPSAVPSAALTLTPSNTPSKSPSNIPTVTHSSKPSMIPSASDMPSAPPTRSPTSVPTVAPTKSPTDAPTIASSGGMRSCRPYGVGTITVHAFIVSYLVHFLVAG